MELVDELLVRLFVMAVVGDPEVAIHRAQELGGAEGGIEDEGAQRALVEPLEEVAAEGRLPRSHLTRHHDESAALPQSELEMGESLVVLPGQVEKFRIWREVEGLLAKAVEGLVHVGCPYLCITKVDSFPAAISGQS